MELCSTCARTISDTETPYVWRETNIVCEACWRILTAAFAIAGIPADTSTAKDETAPQDGPARNGGRARGKRRRKNAAAKSRGRQAKALNAQSLPPAGSSSEASEVTTTPTRIAMRPGKMGVTYGDGGVGRPGWRLYSDEALWAVVYDADPENIYLHSGISSEDLRPVKDLFLEHIHYRQLEIAARARAASRPRHDSYVGLAIALLGWELGKWNPH